MLSSLVSYDSLSRLLRFSGQEVPVRRGRMAVLARRHGQFSHRAERPGIRPYLQSRPRLSRDGAAAVLISGGGLEPPS
jgi:hypothetical protein